MVGKNRVEVHIDGVDKLSPVLNKIQGQIGGLGMATGAWTALFTKGIDVALAGMGKLSSAFNEAGQMQSQLLTSSQGLANITGASFEEAKESVRDLRQEMSLVAADLPGTTKDYTNLALAISDTMASLNPGKNLKELNKVTAEAATDFGLLQSAAQTGAEETALAIDKLLNGQVGEALQMQFFERNTAFRNTFLRLAEEKHGKARDEISDLTMQQRSELLDLAREQAITPEFKAAIQEMPGAMIEGLRSSLFDPVSGLFGILRDTLPDVEGDQSLYAGIGKTIKSLFGSTGLFSTFGKVLGTLGIEADPMGAAYQGAIKVAKFIDRVNSIFVDFGANLEMDAFGSGTVAREAVQRRIMLFVRELPQRLGGWINGLVEQFRGTLGNLDVSGAGASMGNIASNVVSWTINAITSYVSTIDYEQLGRGMAQAVDAGFDFVIAALAGADWIDVIQAVNGFIDAAVNAAAAFVRGIGLEVLGGLASAAAEAASSARAAFGLMVSNIADKIHSIGRAVASAFTGQLGRLESMATNALGNIRMPDFGGPIFNRAEGQNVGGLMGAVEREMSQAPGTLPVVANSSEAILNTGQIQDLLGTVRSGAEKLAAEANVTGINGLLDSVRSGADRLGSQPVQELIGLVKGNLGQRDTRPAPTLNLGGLTLNVAGQSTANPEQLAEQVMSAIESKWAQFEQNLL